MMKQPALACTASLILAAGIAAAPMTAHAEFPDKPVTLVVPFAAGGPSDKIARDIAEAMRKPLGQTVVVENTAGAGGTIGTARVARAAPDGYTLLVHHIGLATAPALYHRLGYKMSDLEPVGLINEAPSTLIGRLTLPANSLAELRKAIANGGGTLNLANAGVGSASHLCSLMLQSSLKSSMTFIPYKGTGPAMSDLLGGQVDLMCEQATNSTPQIEAKKVKAYGVTGLHRSAVRGLSGIPTLGEGGLPGFNFQVWHGVYAPHGTPPAVVQKINAALRVALKDPDLIRREEALGITIVSDQRLSPAGHKAFLNGEIARWGKIIQEAGIQPE